jgi:hypothetical protein
MTNPQQVDPGATATKPRNLSPDSQTRVSSHRQLKWALDQARRDFVDLSRRNRLLHAPLSGKRPWCMAIVGHSPDELFDKLYRQENFRGYGFSAHRRNLARSRFSQMARGLQLRYADHDFRHGLHLISLNGVLQRSFAKNER